MRASRGMAAERARSSILAIELRRLEIRKTREHCGLDELQVSNGACQFLEPSLAVRDIGREEILMIIVERLPLEIFIGPVSEGDGCTREGIVNAPVEPGLLPLRLLQCRVDRRQDGTDPHAVGLRITLGGAGLETLVLAAGAEKIVRARSQEQLKHLGHPTFEIQAAYHRSDIVNKSLKLAPAPAGFVRSRPAKDIVKMRPNPVFIRQAATKRQAHGGRARLRFALMKTASADFECGRWRLQTTLTKHPRLYGAPCTNFFSVRLRG